MHSQGQGGQKPTWTDSRREQLLIWIENLSLSDFPDSNAVQLQVEAL